MAAWRWRREWGELLATQPLAGAANQGLLSGSARFTLLKTPCGQSSIFAANRPSLTA